MYATCLSGFVYRYSPATNDWTKVCHMTGNPGERFKVQWCAVLRSRLYVVVNTWIDPVISALQTQCVVCIENGTAIYDSPAPTPAPPGACYAIHGESIYMFHLPVVVRFDTETREWHEEYAGERFAVCHLRPSANGASLCAW